MSRLRTVIGVDPPQFTLHVLVDPGRGRATPALGLQRLRKRRRDPAGLRWNDRCTPRTETC
jgi:hypothetical protein